jgi:hypothetical protein
MANLPTRVRVNTLRDLDALVAEHITGEVPEIYWEDAHATLRFESEQEAREALERLKAQPTLPPVNWESMAVTQVKAYLPYSADVVLAWGVVEKIAMSENCLRVRREKGMWHARFGDRAESRARSAPVAICAAALRAVDVEAVFDPDWIH